VADAVRQLTVAILALNAGSSSLKFALFDGASADPFESGRIDLERESIDLTSAAGRAVAGAQAAADGRGGIEAVGHRIVHGGRFRESVILDASVEDEIARLATLAPLHNPPAIAVLHAARRALPGVPHVAAFDTSFFAGLPPRAHVYPLPWEWYE
jgi:acetate kinase